MTSPTMTPLNESSLAPLALIVPYRIEYDKIRLPLHAALRYCNTDTVLYVCMYVHTYLKIHPSLSLLLQPASSANIHGSIFTMVCSSITYITFASLPPTSYLLPYVYTHELTNPRPKATQTPPYHHHHHRRHYQNPTVPSS